MGGAVTRGDFLERVTLVEDNSPQPLQLVEEDHLAPKGEEDAEKRAAPPSTPNGGGAEKGKNTENRKLNLHSKCLQAAGMEVKFPEAG